MFSWSRTGGSLVLVNKATGASVEVELPPYAVYVMDGNLATAGKVCAQAVS